MLLNLKKVFELQIGLLFALEHVNEEMVVHTSFQGRSAPLVIVGKCMCMCYHNVELKRKLKVKTDLSHKNSPNIRQEAIKNYIRYQAKMK